MTAGTPADETTDTETAIMEATYRALQKHGYADLSISNIADEFEMSKSLLYYHYEDKDELLVAFLDHIIGRFSEDIAVDAWTDPEVQLRSFFDRLLPTTLATDRREFQVALFELRAQAPHHETYRERFTTTDRLIRETIAEYITAGIEENDFRDVDPDETAQLFLSVINGGMLERVTTDDSDPIEDLRGALDDYVSRYLTVAEPI